MQAIAPGESHRMLPLSNGYQPTKGTILRHCGYWVSLREQPETQNSTAVTVELPRSNQFTVESITSIINRISQGGLP
ncbi:MAG: DUF4365 domain-containing protein [Oscillatoriales cyanobacterium RU_3_3]|nr:DUF4365 domain-containing protein [Oscillatoriales cyanobacterium RU_3_3]NJR25045.1 DUF4365 domain-containing protein [Richelia sp. CSU_2_1]